MSNVIVNGPDGFQDLEQFQKGQQDRGLINVRQRLEVGDQVIVQTMNSRYDLQLVDKDPGMKLGFMIQGTDRFPEPTPIWLSGSTLGGSMLWMDQLGIGMHMELVREREGMLLTSPVESIQIKQKSKTNEETTNHH